MEKTSERILRVIVYYGLMALVLASLALFVARLVANDEISIWIKVIYYIWSGVFALVMLLDVFCVNARRTRWYIGYMLLGLTVAAIIMADVLFMNLNVMRALGTATEVTFMGFMTLCFLPTVLAIVSYFVGRKVMLSNE